MDYKSISYFLRVSILFLLLQCFTLSSCQSKNSIRSTEKSLGITEWKTTLNEKSENLGAEKPQLSQTNLTIASWNIQDLGRTKSAEEITAIADILRDFDIVAVQEVVAKDPAGAQAVAKIADELNRMGSKWDYRVSDPTKSPSVYKSERYAYFWKTSKVSLIHPAYLDSELEDICSREPYIAAFKLKGKVDPFYLINFHSRKYNDRPEEEIIHFLDYPERLQSERIIILGDFNLDEKHQVWKPFYRNGFKSGLQNTRTTLKVKCKNGDYLSHAIDNFYFTPGIKMVQSGSLDFIGNCENLKPARALSDHLPVYLEFKFEEK